MESCIGGDRAVKIMGAIANHCVSFTKIKGDIERQNNFSIAIAFQTVEIELPLASDLSIRRIGTEGDKIELFIVLPYSCCEIQESNSNLATKPR